MSINGAAWSRRIYIANPNLLEIEHSSCCSCLIRAGLPKKNLLLKKFSVSPEQKASCWGRNWHYKKRMGHKKTESVYVSSWRAFYVCDGWSAIKCNEVQQTNMCFLYWSQPVCIKQKFSSSLFFHFCHRPCCMFLSTYDTCPSVHDTWSLHKRILFCHWCTLESWLKLFYGQLTQVHLELLFCPFGMDSVFMKGFKPDYALTTLEKALRPEAANFSQANSEKKGDILFRGVLSVTVISAEDVPVTDLMGKSDPFVVLIMKKSEQKNKTRVSLCVPCRIPHYLPPTCLIFHWVTLFQDFEVQQLLGTHCSCESQVLNNTLNPVWNQTFDFVVEDGLHDLLILEVWDHDTFGKVNSFGPSCFHLGAKLLLYCVWTLWGCFIFFNFCKFQDKIGRCIMTLTRVILEEEFKDTFTLDGAKSGRLTIHLKWTPQPIIRDWFIWD